MKHIYSILVVTFFIGCGNDSYYENKEKVRLLNAKESNQTVEVKAEKNTTSTPIVVKKPIKTTVAIDEKETKSPQIENEDNETHLKSIDTKMINLAEISKFDKEMAWKGFELESELKKLEIEQKSVIIANEKEIALAKIEQEKLLAQKRAVSDQKKAELEAQNLKEIELAKLESQKAIALNEKEVALAELEVNREQKDKELELYKLIAAVVAGLVILILLIIYMIHRRNKKIQLQLHEDELMHQKYMEASKQHNENLKKMLDIVTDEKIDKGIKKDIVRLLKDQGKQSDLIEHKKR